MPIKVNGASSGSVTLAAPASGSDVTVTLPGTAGTVPLVGGTNTWTGTQNFTGATVTGAGMDLVASQAFSSATSVSLDSCFTATYANYYLVWTVDTFASTASLTFRLRVGGSDNSTSNYSYGGSYTNYGTTLAGDGGTGQTSWAATAQASHGVLAMSLFSPQRAAVTYGNVDVTGGTSQAKYGYRFGATTQFDGITFLSSAAATGNVRVYGLRNS